jgi:hypothetical protein
MRSYFRKQPRFVLARIVSSAPLLCGAAHAADPGTNPFVVTVYSNARGAEALLNGHYDAAISQIGTAGDLDEASPSADTTNLCVAQIMSGQFAIARATCDAAVKTARSASRASVTWGPDRSGASQDMAVAYANRAVLYWIGDEMERAAADLAAAQRLAPKADCVTLNLSALKSPHPIVAQIHGAP